MYAANQTIPANYIAVIHTGSAIIRLSANLDELAISKKQRGGGFYACLCFRNKPPRAASFHPTRPANAKGEYCTKAWQEVALLARNLAIPENPGELLNG